MIQIFFLAVIIIFGSSLFLYRYTGKKRFLKFDLVQMIYAYVIAPLVFVWMKTFAFYLARAEIHALSQSQLFLVDTVISLVGLFVYSFVILHFITKNFEIRRYRDPLTDIFQLSEVIHLWISHIGIFFGLLLMATLISILNVVFPLEAQLSPLTFYLILFFGFILGLIAFVGVWLSNFTKRKFIRINRIMFALQLLLLLVTYFVSEVSFESQYSAYWFFFFTYLGSNLLSIFIEKSEKLINKIEKLQHKFEDGWSSIKGKFLSPK